MKHGVNKHAFYQSDKGPVVQNLRKLLAKVMLKLLSCNMAKTLKLFC